ncbi:heavy metal translocating P-type ATPase [Floricoccus penangensis]|uniref:heavy metal translocating P-type ATPase n=1 Tax=Floricoccus penangensis TaxID=1859475 RepID=UPI00204255FB|nr:heavy metal translocating P-type ATPase [Floricoccus penangensis]URZ88419.1 cadmium-translocating P-type ATPase [Floricoccus penangensis]
MKKINLHFDQEAREKITLIVISVVLTIIAMFLRGSQPLISTIIFLIAYLISAQRVLRKAWKNIKSGNFFSENILMSIATIGALLIGEYPEAIAVMVLYEIGDIIEDMAVDRSKRSISNLLEAKPEFAHLKVNNDWQTVDPSVVKIDDIIMVKPGEKIPLDGLVISGSSSVNTAALTGESVPVTVTDGDQVLGGSVNQEGVIEVKATKVFEDSAVAKILELVQNASDSKAPTEKFISKFANYYTPVVVLAALLLAVIPPLFFGQSWSVWIGRALTFLVISCPCALVISVPLGFFAGIGSASKNGVLIKGSNFLEALNDLDTVVFDKTGTLTEGVFEVTNIDNQSQMSDDDFIALVAAVEQNSNHPIAKSILSYNKADLTEFTLSSVEEVAGHGLKAKVDDRDVTVGNMKAMKALGLEIDEKASSGTLVYVAIDGTYQGVITVSDKIKPDAKKAIQRLQDLGIQNLVMLTGDNKAVADIVAKELGITQVYANLLPEDKVAILEKLKAESHSNKKKIAFTGDGINDTPALTLADIGISMGGLGSDAAVEASDIVIMQDQPSKIPTSIEISRYTRKIIMQNIIFALGVKTLFMILSTFGIASMWQAVFADVGVTFLAVMNTLRIMRKDYKN